MNFHLYGVVDCLHHKKPLAYQGRELCFEVNMNSPQKDRLKALVGDGLARVSVSVSEKVSGPDYSSMSISVTVTMTCDQNEKTVATAREEALGECLTFLDAQLADVQTCFLKAVDDAMERERQHKADQ